MDWTAAGERLDSPILEPLQVALRRLPRDRSPDLADLNALAAGLTTARGKALRFVRARAPGDRERRSCYELHLDETGEVETRPGNWHDLFNALAWITYPRAKTAINAQHVAILEERGYEHLAPGERLNGRGTVRHHGHVELSAGGALDPGLTPRR